jgi:hypothetical protein
MALLARAFVGGTVALGAAAVAVAAVRGAAAPLGVVALLCAAAVVAEYFQAESGDTLVGEGSHTFSFSSGVHLAAVVIAGPFAAAMAAAVGVLLVDGVARKSPTRILFNASVLALSSTGGGAVYILAGGDPGSFALPGDLLPLAAMALTYSVLNTVFVGIVVALSAGMKLWPLLRASALGDATSDLAEAGIGGVLAFFALANPWAIILLTPLAFTAYQAHARLAQLRRETAQALETFANVVDERDPYTYRHSESVADLVSELGEALQLPAAEVARLRLAGRLHDLGKISVDASVLRKPGALSDDEFEAMRRHPRLSARLLRRFRFAREEARAVEYHHERFDGTGYYGIDPAQLPLAAHFLIVADSFDAMTSDRPYRSGMPVEAALAEIERGAGTQFHPAIAKAFAALRRGGDPLAVLTATELAELRRPSLQPRSQWLRVVNGQGPELAVLGGAVGMLLALAVSHPLLATVPALVALAGLVGLGATERRTRRLVDGLRGVVPAEEPFEEASRFLAAETDARWIGLLSWRERDLEGSLEREWTASGPGPAETALKSWLLRDGESAGACLVEAGTELGSDGEHVAVRLTDDDALVGYLVLGFHGRARRSILAALARFPDEVTRRLVDSVLPPPPVAELPRPALRAAG